MALHPVPGGGGTCVLRCVVLAALVVGAFACNLNPFTLGGGGGDGDAAVGDGSVIDGDVDPDATMGDGGMPDACVAFPEVCNGMDDDCDGEIDEGFNLAADPANCGACGNRCAQPNAAGTCVDSECVYTCQPGFVDLDGDPSNGCDYFCTPTNGGVEACDLADNDCDGEFDEGLDLDNDPLNCGGCGVRCLALNAEPLCSGGECGFGPCADGFNDLIAQIPGCEYACPVWPPLDQETCNGVDDDCDGRVDELPIDGLGDACTDPGFEAYGGVGRCTFGTRACSFGVPVCSGFVRPLANDAICNGIDDDCDGQTDEDVDFDNDPRHCGSCAPCVLPNAIPGCTGGGCTIVACLPGFFDADGDPGNGCEYACTPSGPETCDGRDNDCDGETDEDLTPPTNFCRTQGACAGGAPVCDVDACTGQTRWLCDYGDGAEVDACGDLRFQETLCDGVDGDCDGRVDEAYPLKHTACADGELGICRGTGTFVCAANQTSLTCNITNPGQAATDETCNGLDDDCDGDVDEDAPDPMVEVATGTGSFWIYTWEASRPDASATGFGNQSHRACSRPGVLPWRTVTHTEAAAACAAAGKRLCTEAEWQLACGGPDGLAYPYGNAYQPQACNGRDVDLDCTPPDSDEVAVTGRAFGCPPPATTQCVSPAGAVDLSGNLREWTATQIGDTAFRVKGGGFDNIAQGLRCDFSFIAFEPDVAFPNLGFRCCADAPDPTP